jgi:hypothetical protein
MPSPWTTWDERWKKLNPHQRGALMALMEADGARPQDAQNALAAMVNRSMKSGEDLGRHVSRKIYQPTFEPAQQARIDRLMKSPAFGDLTQWAERRMQGLEPDPVGGATHFLAKPETMLALEARNPSKYKNWGPRGANWTGYDPATGQYRNQTFADKSHAFLAPEGKFSAPYKGRDAGTAVAANGPKGAFEPAASEAIRMAPLPTQMAGNGPQATAEPQRIAQSSPWTNPYGDAPAATPPPPTAPGPQPGPWTNPYGDQPMPPKPAAAPQEAPHGAFAAAGPEMGSPALMGPAITTAQAPPMPSPIEVPPMGPTFGPPAPDPSTLVAAAPSPGGFSMGGLGGALGGLAKMFGGDGDDSAQKAAQASQQAAAQADQGYERDRMAALQRMAQAPGMQKAMMQREAEKRRRWADDEEDPAQIGAFQII